MTEIKQTIHRSKKKKASPSTLIARLNADHCGKKVIRLIEAPHSLQGIDIVTTGCDYLTPQFEAIHAANILHLSTIDSEFIDTLKSGASFLRSSIENEQLDYYTCSGTNPFRGVTDNHPLYTLIGHAAQSIDHPTDTTLKTIAYVIAICRQLNSKSRATLNYDSATNAALSATRIIFERSKGSLLPCPVEDVRLFAGQLHKQLELKPDDPHLQAIERVARFLVDSEGGHLRRAKSRSSDVPLSGEPGQNTIHLERTRSLGKSLSNVGLSLDEIYDGPENALVTRTPDADALPGISRIQLVMLRKNIDMAIQRNNQCLRNDYGNLTDAETGLILEILHSTSAQRVKQQHSAVKPHAHEIEAAVLAYVALLSGQLLKVALLLKITHSFEPGNNADDKSPLIYSLDDGCLYFQVLRPSGSPSYVKTNKCDALQTTNLISLPIGRYVGELIKILPACQKGLQSQSETMPFNAFTQKITKLNSAALRIFSKVKIHPDRLHDSFRSGALFSRVLNGYGLFPVASIIANKPHRLSNTGLHYLCTSTELLHKTYTSTVDRMLALAGINPLAFSSPVATITASPQHAGSPLNPQKEQLLNWVALLRANICSSRKNVLTQNYWLDLHNAHALYIDFMLRFALGLRDVDMPLPSWDRINLDRQTVFIDDKGDIAGTGSRVLPIGPIVIGQLIEWRSYLERNTPELIDLGAEKSTILSGPVIQFLIRSDRQIKLVHPTAPLIREYRKRILGSFDLPVNCNRHYLYSTLSEHLFGNAQSPSASSAHNKNLLELIDVAFGHTHRGREPGGIFSMLSPAIICEKLRRPLNQVLGSLGFRIERDLH